MSFHTLQVVLDDDDQRIVRELAESTGFSETEVLRRGLRLFGRAYGLTFAQTQRGLLSPDEDGG